MSRFGEATRVERTGDEVWTTQIARGWDIAGRANGGYLLVLAARAMAEAAGRPDPVTVTAHYLRPGEPGPAEVRASRVRAGRRFATATGVLQAGGRPLLQALGTFSDLEGSSGPERVDAAPPELPAPDDCTTQGSDEVGGPPFMDRVDLRLHPTDAGFRRGEPSGDMRVRGWFRLRDQEAIDSLGLLLAVDAFPPTIFNARMPRGWVPTLELTAHVRARPCPGWLRCAFTTRFVTGGFLEEDGEVWDSAGRLVAQSRQLALVPSG
ncbi:MAG: thioesterase family protein [Myxococcota bacterium]